MTAAYSTGTATGAGAVNNFFLTIRTAILANGWTELDVISNSAGSRDVIFRSSPLDATAGNCCFIRLTQTATTIMTQRAYQDWDTSTHAGTRVAGQGGGGGLDTYQDSSFTYFLRVNEFAFAWVAKISSSYVKGYCGFLRRGLAAAKAGMSRTSGVISAGTTAGTSVPLASDLTGKLQPGQVVTLMNYGHASGSANAAHAEALTVATVGASSLTFTTNIVSAYDAGAVIGENVYPVLVTGAVSGGVAAGAIANTTSVIFHDGTYTGVASTMVVAATAVPFHATVQNAPSSTTQEYASGVWSMSFTTASHAGFLGYLYHWEYSANNAQTSEDIMDDGDNTFLFTNNNCILGPR